MKTYDNIRKFSSDQGDDLHNWLFTRLSLFQKLL